nr:pentatricopeptide repeat-containing protein At3g49740 [Ipomoea batatas]GMC99203.1 pentatricopeptide repeat-containing protein At3g49740 [Ipomoea batatas]
MLCFPSTPKSQDFVTVFKRLFIDNSKPRCLFLDYITVLRVPKLGECGVCSSRKCILWVFHMINYTFASVLSLCSLELCGLRRQVHSDGSQNWVFAPQLAVHQCFGDTFTLTAKSVVDACWVFEDADDEVFNEFSCSDAMTATQIHALVVKQGFGDCTSVSNAAETINLISWNGNDFWLPNQMDFLMQSLNLFSELLAEGLRPNAYTSQHCA